MPNPLQVAKDYGSAQGYRVRTRKLLRRPDHWRWDYYGCASLVPDTGQPRAEIAWVGQHSPEWLAMTLWHELGHCEQYASADMAHAEGPKPDDAYARWLVECDAWERGLAAASETGFVITSDLAEQALECLLSYYQATAWEMPPVVDWLMDIAYGEE